MVAAEQRLQGYKWRFQWESNHGKGLEVRGDVASCSKYTNRGETCDVDEIKKNALKFSARQRNYFKLLTPGNTCIFNWTAAADKSNTAQ